MLCFSGGYFLLHEDGADKYLDLQFAAPKTTSSQVNE